ncbi:5-hydroxytryptamine receptor 2B isoform X2 [Hippocampus comes]|uniref:5-hydroxytryptamine receptor 2B isoform X2 n=1 Tax=Hippocampus comes TaxID=109280 RepID=UPI00094E854A|nr:PREDICTED: 5-hydroxytryptamine receptor 2B isoform X2 [Hippocampus comes]
MSQSDVAPLEADSSLSETSGVPLKWAALLFVMVIVPTIGGNILVILAVSLEKKLQNATNYFLMSLAVADLLVGLLVMPIALVTVLYSIAIPIPIKGLQNYQPRNNITFNSNHTCQLKTDTFREFIMFGSMAAFFVPLIIMMVIYLLTVHVLRKKVYLLRSKVIQRFSYPAVSTVFQRDHARTANQVDQFHVLDRLSKMQENPNVGTAKLPPIGEIPFRRMSTMGKKSMQTLSNEQRASKVLGIVFLLFVVMWCPFFITNVTSVLCTSCDVNIISRLMEIFVWVGYISSGINPLVYTLFNKTFREAFTRYITCNYKTCARHQPDRNLKASNVARTLTRISFRSSMAENSKLFMKRGMRNGIGAVGPQSPPRCRSSAHSCSGVMLDTMHFVDSYDAKQEEHVSRL